MNHADHIALIRAGVHHARGMWADFGSGRGAFTCALAEILPAPSQLYAIDRDAAALTALRGTIARHYPDHLLVTLKADFTRPLNLPPLDGILVATALHFYSAERQLSILRQLIGYLKPGGTIIIVEYDVSHAVSYIPHPLDYSGWLTLAEQLNLENPHRIGRYRRSSGGFIYAAAAISAGLVPNSS